ncbi:unnamed protein product, partial [Ectocarpus sp. 12 AP-2014]
LLLLLLLALLIKAPNPIKHHPITLLSTRNTSTNPRFLAREGSTTYVRPTPETGRHHPSTPKIKACCRATASWYSSYFFLTSVWLPYPLSLATIESIQLPL